MKSSRSVEGRGVKKNEKDLRAKHQSIMNGLLQKEENKFCADCNCRDPRWASWNLGIFLCIRCAGIHRNLGVHISRVKSVDLDSWTSEQMESICGIGNAIARSVYEESLPENFPRPQTDYALEVLIRAKYEQKKYVVKGEGSLSATSQLSKTPAVLSSSQSEQKLAVNSSKKSSKHRRKTSSGQLDASPSSKHRSGNKSSSRSGRVRGDGDADSKSVDSLLLGLDNQRNDKDEDLVVTVTPAIKLLSLDDSSIQDAPRDSVATSSAQSLSTNSSATLPGTSELLFLSASDTVTYSVGSRPSTFDPIHSSLSTNQIAAVSDFPISTNGETGSANSYDVGFLMDGKPTLVDKLFDVGHETEAERKREEMKKSSSNNDILSLYARSAANANRASAILPNSSVPCSSGSNVASHWSAADGSESSAVIGQTLCHSLWQ